MYVSATWGRGRGSGISQPGLPCPMDKIPKPKLLPLAPFCDVSHTPPRGRCTPSLSPCSFGLSAPCRARRLNVLPSSGTTSAFVLPPRVAGPLRRAALRASLSPAALSPGCCFPVILTPPRLPLVDLGLQWFHGARRPCPRSVPPGPLLVGHHFAFLFCVTFSNRPQVIPTCSWRSIC